MVTESFDNSLSDLKTCARSVEQRAHELLSRHPHFRERAGTFEYECREDLLIVRGRVPTFYLKQVLQTVLRDVEGVTCVDNRVDVISSNGISSVRKIAGQASDGA